MKKPIKDVFYGRCRAKARNGKRCSRLIRIIVCDITVSRKSWLDALKTGWPRMVKGMKSPEYHEIGFCGCHHKKYSESTGRPFYIFGVGNVGLPLQNEKLKKQYEKACKIGDDAVRAAGWSV